MYTDLDMICRNFFSFSKCSSAFLQFVHIFFIKKKSENVGIINKEFFSDSQVCFPDTFYAILGKIF